MEYKCRNCGCSVPKIIYKDITSPPTCSRCGISYPEKSNQEAEFAIAQDTYLQNKTKVNLFNLLEKIMPICENVIKNFTRRYPGLFIDIERAYDIKIWCYETLYKYYTKKSNYKIDSCLNMYLRNLLLSPIFGKIKEDENLSLEYIYENDNKSSSAELSNFISTNENKNTIDINNIFLNTIDNFMKNKSYFELFSTLQAIESETLSNMTTHLSFYLNNSICDINSCKKEFLNLLKKNTTRYE